MADRGARKAAAAPSPSASPTASAAAVAVAAPAGSAGAAGSAEPDHAAAAPRRGPNGAGARSPPRGGGGPVPAEGGAPHAAAAAAAATVVQGAAREGGTFAGPSGTHHAAAPGSSSEGGSAAAASADLAADDGDFADDLDDPAGAGDADGSQLIMPAPGGPEGLRELMVSGVSRPNRVAGALAQLTRAGECPDMLATGSRSIFQCLRAVSIARAYLEQDGLDLDAFPSFRPEKRMGLSLSMRRCLRGAPDGLAFQPLLDGASPAGGGAAAAGAAADNGAAGAGANGVAHAEGASDSSSTTSSAAAAAAAAAAGGDPGASQLKVSKNSGSNHVAGAVALRFREGRPCSLLAIGPEALTHAVKAVAIARKYVASDGLDISFRARAVTVTFPDGRTTTGLELLLTRHQI